jgi:3-oxoacyl-[acyl-carrier protein] reductase
VRETRKVVIGEVEGLLFTVRHKFFRLYSQVVDVDNGLLKRVVITGGRGGLGSAVVDEFSSRGWDVRGLGREDLDVCDEVAVREYFAEVGCDLLVCCAGLIRDEVLFRMDEASWDDIFRVNFHGARLCAEAVIKGMVERGGGHVVFVSSYAGLHPDVGQAAYGTAKAALLGLMRDLAGLYGSRGVRVNAVLPGFVETGMTAGVSEERRDEVRRMHVLGEFNREGQVAKFVRFLDEEMLFTSGQVFSLDSR